MTTLLLIGTAVRSPRPDGNEKAVSSGAFVRKSQRIAGNRRTAQDPALLAAALASGNARDKKHSLEILLPELIDRDIRAAARMAETLDPWACREEVLFLVARAWAARDPAAAAGWARQLPDAVERHAVFGHVCIAIANDDPVQALELAGNELPLQGQLLQLLAAKDPEAALRWAGKQTDADTREMAFARIAIGHAEASPEEAARLVADQLPPGPLQDETALAVLHRWILRDPVGARAWVEIFPDGSLLRIAESELAAAAAYPAAE